MLVYWLESFEHHLIVERASELKCNEMVGVLFEQSPNALSS